MAEHGGTIEVNSTLGVGTSFTPRFPRSGEVAEPSAQSLVPVSSGNRTGTVLVVDDSELTREVTCPQLRRAGYEVVAAGSGAEALSVLLSDADPVDLLLTAVVMPGMTGRELADRAWLRRTALPVLFMSGYTDEHIELGDVDLEHDLILKPFSLKKLVHPVERKLRLPLRPATKSHQPQPAPQV